MRAWCLLSLAATGGDQAQKGAPSVNLRCFFQPVTTVPLGDPINFSDYHYSATCALIQIDD
jgi:hypothetical protein